MFFQTQEEWVGLAIAVAIIGLFWFIINHFVYKQIEEDRLESKRYWDNRMAPLWDERDRQNKEFEDKMFELGFDITDSSNDNT